MKCFVTFGQKYHYQEHSLLPNMHPDGMLEIEADNALDARAVAELLLGIGWSDIYTEYELPEEMRNFYHPAGVLVSVKASDPELITIMHAQLRA